MKLRTTIFAGAFLISSVASAEFNFYSSSALTAGVTSVSNTGLAVGVGPVASGWQLWNPGVSSSHTAIGGVVTGTAGISWDGKYVGATALAGDGKAEMARYDVTANSWTTLGGGGGFSGANRSVGTGISGDGQTVIGYGYGTYTGTGTGTFTGINPLSHKAGVMTSHNIIPNANSINRINASNYDGTILTGRMRYYSSGTSQADGAYYYSGGTANAIMGAGNNFYGEPRAISGDGRYVGGNFNSFTGTTTGTLGTRRPYIYDTATGSATVLDSVAGLNGNPILANITLIDGQLTGISADGSKAVGFFRSTSPSFLDKTWGFIWERGVGIQSIDIWAAANGITDAGNTWLVPTAISPDGNTIGGYQFTRTGFTPTGFMITQAVPEPGTALALGLGLIALTANRRKGRKK